LRDSEGALSPPLLQKKKRRRSKYIWDKVTVQGSKMKRGRGVLKKITDFETETGIWNKSSSRSFVPRGATF